MLKLAATLTNYLGRVQTGQSSLLETVNRTQQEQQRLKKEAEAGMQLMDQATKDFLQSRAETQQKSVLADVEHWRERLVQMGCSLSKTATQTYETLFTTVVGALRLAKQAPNNNQFAIAAHAIDTLQKPRKKPCKLLYAVPPGMGKSRISSVLTFLAPVLNVTRVVYYFSHPQLQGIDEQALTQLRQVVDTVTIETRCVTDKGTTIEAGSDTLVVIDEADHIVVDLSTTVRAQMAVGLTATAASDDVFTQYISILGWVVKDSKIATDLDAATPYDAIESLDKFLAATQGQPRLIYGNDSTLEELRTALDDGHSLKVN